MLDWEGMLASTVFLPRCNFRCPFCQNPDLVLHPERLETLTLAELDGFLEDREGWIEGVCITGGEPCLHGDLPSFCSEFKGRGLGVKLDTNGSFPEMLEELFAQDLVDFIAMDIKAPLEPGPYRLASGNEQPDLLDLVGRSIEAIKTSGISHEFRTTVVPLIHGPAEVAAIAEALGGGERLVLQNFSPKVTLDPRYSELRPFTGEDMDLMLREARRFVDDAVIRGAPQGFD